MKITIEVDIDPNEIDLATELLSTLRAFTDHVSVKRGGAQAQNHAPPPQAAPKPEPERAAQQPSPDPFAAASPFGAQPPSAMAPYAAAPSPAPQQAPPSAPAAVHASAPAAASAFARPPQAQQQQQPPAAVDRQTASAPVPQLISQQKWADLLFLVEPPPHEKLEEVAKEVTRLLASNPANFDTFFDTFVKIVLSPQMALAQRSVVPFMNLLPLLPPETRAAVRDQLIPMVMKHLAVKRPIDANRADFFAHAEAFASIVFLEFVSIPGAVQTTIALMEKPETRCAAITMLGKTVELCWQQLKEKCSEEEMAALKRSVFSVEEEVFKYDVDYIREYMMPSAEGAEVLEVGYPATLAASVSWTGHEGMVFAVCYDGKRRRVMSGGREAAVLVRDDAGNLVHRIDTGEYFCFTLDIHAPTDTLLIGQTRTGPRSLITCHSTTDDSYTLRGVLRPPENHTLSALRAMPDMPGFVIGEEITRPEGKEVVVSYYDISAGWSDLQPTVAMRGGHETMTTAMCPFPASPACFLSGSRDHSVLLWDLRQPAAPAARFLARRPGAPPFSRDDKTAPILTCLDARGNYVMAGSVDKHVVVFDIRQMQGGASTAQQPLHAVAPDDAAVLKVALWPGRPDLAAVSTYHGLHCMDLSQGEPVLTRAMEFEGRGSARYHDIRWADTLPQLYAASADSCIDTFQLV